MPEALRFLGLNSIQEPPISEAEVFARPRQAQPAQSAGSDASSFPWPPASAARHRQGFRVQSVGE